MPRLEPKPGANQVKLRCRCHHGWARFAGLRFDGHSAAKSSQSASWRTLSDRGNRVMKCEVRCACIREDSFTFNCERACTSHTEGWDTRVPNPSRANLTSRDDAFSNVASRTRVHAENVLANSHWGIVRETKTGKIHVLAKRLIIRDYRKPFYVSVKCAPLKKLSTILTHRLLPRLLPAVYVLFFYFSQN